MENHSYINAEYKCLDCDFICDGYFEMEVHIRKEHSEKFECSLCGLRGESLDERLHIKVTTRNQDKEVKI